MQWGSNQRLVSNGEVCLLLGIVILVVGGFYDSFYLNYSLSNVPFFNFILGLGTIIIGSGLLLIGVMLTLMGRAGAT